MMDCHDVMKRLWEYMDDELTPDDTAAVREHLEMCARCHPQYRFQLAFLAALAAAFAHPGVGPAPRAEFRERLRAVLSSLGS